MEEQREAVSGIIKFNPHHKLVVLKILEYTKKI